ncbi:hypothetical protein ISS30_03315 [bacterium]|nr:hypothetical protein [bacterium]
MTTKNSIFSYNTSNAGVVDCNYCAPNISYSDFFGNTGINFFGSLVPAGLGVISSTNLNGDPCDVYYNIFLDPLFADPGNGNYNLTIGSPCVDAGDPGFPLDPDGTTIEIGAFYFPQTILLDPDNVDFGEREITFTYTDTVMIRNNGEEDAVIDTAYVNQTYFGFDQSIIGAVVPAGDSLAFWVSFSPEEITGYSDMMQVIIDGSMHNLILEGEGIEIIPLPVENLTVSIEGADAVLNWDAVTQSVQGNPITPDAYIIFYSDSTVYGYEHYQYLWYVTGDTTFTHIGVAQFAQSMFYFVEAYLGEIGILDEITAMDEPIGREEFLEILK